MKEFFSSYEEKVKSYWCGILIGGAMIERNEERVGLSIESMYILLETKTTVHVELFTYASQLWLFLLLTHYFECSPECRNAQGGRVSIT